MTIAVDDVEHTRRVAEADNTLAVPGLVFTEVTTCS
jgi:hypothetical protein